MYSFLYIKKLWLGWNIVEFLWWLLHLTTINNTLFLFLLKRMGTVLYFAFHFANLLYFLIIKHFLKDKLIYCATFTMDQYYIVHLLSHILFTVISFLIISTVYFWSLPPPPPVLGTNPDWLAGSDRDKNRNTR